MARPPLAGRRSPPARGLAAVFLAGLVAAGAGGCKRHRHDGGGTPAAPLTAEAPAPPDIPKGAWRRTGSLLVPRSEHTATLLPDGTVLVAGGRGRGGALASAELYDPRGGTWHETGSMAGARAHHTATLLPGGRVLVVGGIQDGNPAGLAIASAELYDPRTGTWKPTRPLAAPRAGHGAILLPHGEVLVLGGFANKGQDELMAAATLEKFDPVTERWSPAGPPAHKDYGAYSGIPLPGGDVLVIGRDESYEHGLGACIVGRFDPVRETWGSPSYVQDVHCFGAVAVLPGGDVLLQGALFRPSRGEFVPHPSSGASGFHAWGRTETVLLSGRVLAVGAGDVGDETRRALGREDAAAIPSLYDPPSGAWVAAPGMADERAWHTATRLAGGEVLVAGGLGSGEAGPLSGAELYVPPPVAAEAPEPTGR